ncbi:hypothetical protein RHGRI_017706 [Rhododendron griersonianum]|uniref:GPI-anchored protein LLG1-like domain-containing protein n=1 Tax=Rhododendron griersonianum TaxID=479676 RepID=A0AAV6JYT1_9ERIC|nr:hypothetical protein RHGRI_017706 [Rhododendron griersonianum]
MASNNRWFYVILFALLTGLASSTFIPACTVDFEHQNYTIITSQCKGPNFQAGPCCAALKEFACPYSVEISNEKSDCASTMFSYINAMGNYPPALFSSLCVEGKQGLDCVRGFVFLFNGRFFFFSRLHMARGRLHVTRLRQGDEHVVVDDSIFSVEAVGPQAEGGFGEMRGRWGLRRRRSLRREHRTTGAISKLVRTLDPSAASPLSRRRTPPPPSCRTCGASGGIALSSRESLPIIFLGGRADNPETKMTTAERSGTSSCATTTSPDPVPGRSQ